MYVAIAMSANGMSNHHGDEGSSSIPGNRVPVTPPSHVGRHRKSAASRPRAWVSPTARSRVSLEC